MLGIEFNLIKIRLRYEKKGKIRLGLAVGTRSRDERVLV